MQITVVEGRPNFKRCATCKYFHDPCSTTISPKRGVRGGWWVIEADLKKQCRNFGTERKAGTPGCRYYECKI